MRLKTHVELMLIAAAVVSVALKVTELVPFYLLLAIYLKIRRT